MTLLHDRRSAGKVGSPLIARDLRLTILSFVPASFLSQEQVAASWSSCFSLPDLPALHHDWKKLNVLPRERWRYHEEQNQCKFHNQHNTSFACVRCSPCGPCVDENMMECAFEPLVRKLCTSIWTRTSRCWPTCFAFYSGCCYVNAIMSLCTRQELAHVRRNAVCFGQWYNLFRIITQNNSVQQTTIRSALERFVLSCPVIGFGRPYLVVVVRDTNVESGCVLGVDSGGRCRSQGDLFGRFLSAEVCFDRPKMRMYQDRHSPPGIPSSGTPSAGLRYSKIRSISCPWKYPLVKSHEWLETWSCAHQLREGTKSFTSLISHLSIHLWSRILSFQVVFLVPFLPLSNRIVHTNLKLVRHHWADLQNEWFGTRALCLKHPHWSV